MTPYTITVIHIKRDCDSTIIQPLLNQIKELDTFDAIRSRQQDITQTLLKGHIELQHTIFVGIIKDRGEYTSEMIWDILKLITERDPEELQKGYLDVMGQDNIDILSSYFRYDIISAWNIKELFKNTVTESVTISFVESVISSNDTIQYIKQNIYQYIGIVPEHQCLMADILPISDDVTDHTPDKVLLHNMYTNKINIPLEIQCKNRHLPFIEGMDTYTYEEFITNAQLLAHAKKYIYSTIISHTFTHGDTKEPLYIDPNMVHYTHSSYEGYQHLYNSNSILTSFNKTILQNIGTCDRNEIFVYDFQNIYDYVSHHGMFDVDPTSDTFSIFMNGCIKKYFPYIISDDPLYDFKPIYEQSRVVLEENNALIYYKRNIDTSITISDMHVVSLQNVSIHHTIKYPEIIDLKELFNSIELSYEIPFVKFKDPVEIK